MATATSLPSHLAPLRSEASVAIPARGILVVDDHELVRLGLRALLLAETGSVPVHEARSLADALRLYEFHLTSHLLVLLDLDLPDSQGLDTLVRFKRAFPASRVVVLSGKDSHALMHGVMALGAQAFLPKTGHLGEVLRYVRDNDLVALPASSPSPVPVAVRAMPATATDELQPRLNARQVEILDWLLAGKSNKEIAQLSHLTEGTIKNHVSTLLLLFGMRSRAQLISSLK
ncbi:MULTISPECIES: response regulator transcription factor [unclassified Variovorax]|jgi:DNA-binding NarL/FixJ family response regulator|uniref:response regulator transcription factor n=1 Tax=unclassified Variovorax TaxID=663243 RepID=UPI000F7D5BC3|nr:MULTISPECIES: response regulator transcription factor [unclassified Variovorax]RSZ47619.1 response regulator transcription factor [Variovorax sp. 553]RSZ48254.1 response regulator transcription factor [Variovorax sp. 679]